MDNAERLVSRAYEWVNQAAHELCWDDAHTASRKGERERERDEEFDREYDAASNHRCMPTPRRSVVSHARSLRRFGPRAAGRYGVRPGYLARASGS